MKYAVTGATGRLGRQVIQALLEKVPASDVVALARNQVKAQKLLPAGVTIRPGSYEDKAQLTKSLQGVDRLLLISSQPGGELSRIQQHQNVIDAAKASGVSFMAYTSFAKADTTKAPLAADHKITEQAIIAAGLQHSFLRNVWYLENEISMIKTGLAGRPVAYSAGEGRVSWALEADYAQADANALLLDNPKPVYELGGEPHTYEELLAAVKTVTGQDFEVTQVSDVQYEKNLMAAGLPENVAGLLTSFQRFIREGDLEVHSSDLPDLLGHPLPSLTTAVQTIIDKL